MKVSQTQEKQAPDSCIDAPPHGRRALDLLARRIGEFRERRLKAEQETNHDGHRDE